MPYKTENWHTSSHGQYFLEHRVLDTCQYVFKIDNFFCIFFMYLLLASADL